METNVERLPAEVLRQLKHTRRHPSRTQFDYLHVRYLLDALERTLPHIVPNARDVLDIYCGTRPYDDMLPATARVTGLDTADFAGVADVITTEFLPFEDESFDLVMCLEAFYYVPDLSQAVAEIRRVLRPGGAVVITVSLPWEYKKTTLERRYTGPQLIELFEGWDDVEVTENGGFAVSWATLTGKIVLAAEERAPRPLQLVLRPLTAGAYLLINAIGGFLDWAERRRPRTEVLPMNLMLTARRPGGRASGGQPPSADQGEGELEGEMPA